MINFLKQIKYFLFGRPLKDYKIFAQELGEKYNEFIGKGHTPRDAVPLSIIYMMNDAGGGISNGTYSPKGSPLVESDIEQHCQRTFGLLYGNLSINPSEAKTNVILFLGVMTSIYFYDFGRFAKEDTEVKEILNSVINP